MQTTETAALRRGLCMRSKEEIAAKALHTRKERLAFVSGLFVTAGSILIHGESVAVTMSTRNAALLGSLRLVIESLTGKACRIESKTGHNTEIFILGALKLLLECKVLAPTERGIAVCDEIPAEFLSDTAAAVAYVRGAYLGSGSLSIAKYHLEFAFTRESIASDFVRLLGGFDIVARAVQRGEHTVVYLKDSDAISDALALMGAGKSVLDFNAVVVERQMNGQTNRQRNCDLYNIDRQVEASVRQCAQWRELDEALLSPSLRETVRARLQNPEYSYEQLAQSLGISKSGLKNRLRRLAQIYEKTVSH